MKVMEGSCCFFSNFFIIPFPGCVRAMTIPSVATPHKAKQTENNMQCTAAGQNARREERNEKNNLKKKKKTKIKLVFHAIECGA